MQVAGNGAVATGGDGYAGGGNATAEAIGSGGVSATVGVNATSYGGNVSSGGAGNGGGAHGTANADSTASIASNIGVARGVSMAHGSSGLASGHALATHGFVVRASAEAFAPVVGTASAMSVSDALAGATAGANVNLFAVGHFGGIEAGGAAHGAPLPHLLPLSPGLNPNAHAALPSANTDYLAYGALRGGYATDGSGAPVTNTIVLDFELDMSQFTREALKVGFLDPGLEGNGFDEMRFQILEEGVLVFDQIFTSGAAALAFFDDRVIDLGNWITGLTGNLDLQFRMDLTASNSADSFGATLVAGIVPEPAPSALLASSLAMLAAWRRRERCRRR